MCTRCISVTFAYFTFQGTPSSLCFLFCFSCWCFVFQSISVMYIHSFPQKNMRCICNLESKIVYFSLRASTSSYIVDIHIGIFLNFLRFHPNGWGQWFLLLLLLSNLVFASVFTQWNEPLFTVSRFREIKLFGCHSLYTSPFHRHWLTSTFSCLSLPQI